MKQCDIVVSEPHMNEDGCGSCIVYGQERVVMRFAFNDCVDSAGYVDRYRGAVFHFKPCWDPYEAVQHLLLAFQAAGLSAE